MNIYIAEFVGTAILTLLGNGVVANVVLPRTKGFNAGWIVIAAGWAFAVFAAVATVGPYSGAHINPAVTIGLASAGLFDWALVPGYILAQIAGAGAGAWLVYISYYQHYQECEDPGAILSTFSTGPAIRSAKNNFLSESIATFALIFVIMNFTDGSIRIEDDPARVVQLGLGSVGALPVSLLVFAIGLSLGGTTGYAINPARDLGPRIVHALLPMRNKGASDWAYAWIPVAGPILGALTAVCIHRLLS